MAIQPIFQRLALLTGVEVVDALSRTSVILFGAGGVGSWCAEALARSGVGAIAVADSDAVCVTNINRHVQATAATVGAPKAEALKRRLMDINPRGTVVAFTRAFSRETAADFGIEGFEYVIDAIDSVTPKLDLIEYARAAGKTLFSSMGMAQKLDPTRLAVSDIWETRGCPLARLVRSGLRKRGFTGRFKTVYSPERLPLRDRREAGVACGSPECLCPAAKTEGQRDWCASKKVINGSAVTVTATAGMILAGLVIQEKYARAAPERGGEGSG
jgi:tRNA A37 threonylcarbamoyladenosine dehydratase